MLTDESAEPSQLVSTALSPLSDLASRSAFVRRWPAPFLSIEKPGCGKSIKQLCYTC